MLLGIYIFLNLFLKRNKYLRYGRVIIKKEIIFTFVIIYLLSNIYINLLEKRYNSFYNRSTVFNENATVITDAKESNYKYIYEIELDTKQKLLLYVSKNTRLAYGDYIKISGEYVKPSTQRNYRGFDYKEYLKSKEIYGIVKSKDVIVIQKDKIKGILGLANKVKNIIKNKIKSCFDNETASILIGILIGDTSGISIEEKELFRKGSLAHILAVSRNACKLYYGNYYICIRKSKAWQKKNLYFYIYNYIFLYVCYRFYAICSASMYNGNNCPICKSFI